MRNYSKLERCKNRAMVRDDSSLDSIQACAQLQQGSRLFTQSKAYLVSLSEPGLCRFRAECYSHTIRLPLLLELRRREPNCVKERVGARRTHRKFRGSSLCTGCWKLIWSSSWNDSPRRYTTCMHNSEGSQVIPRNHNHHYR